MIDVTTSNRRLIESNKDVGNHQGDKRIKRRKKQENLERNWESIGKIRKIKRFNSQRE